MASHSLEKPVSSLRAQRGFLGSENQSRKCQVTESYLPTHLSKKNIQRSTLQCGEIQTCFDFHPNFWGKWFPTWPPRVFFKMGGGSTTSIAISGPGNSWTCPKGCVQTGPEFPRHPVIPPEVSCFRSVLEVQIPNLRRCLDFLWSFVTVSIDILGCPAIVQIVRRGGIWIMFDYYIIPISRFSKSPTFVGSLRGGCSIKGGSLWGTLRILRARLGNLREH